MQIQVAPSNLLTNLSFVNITNEPSSLVSIHPSFVIPHNCHISNKFRSNAFTV